MIWVVNLTAAFFTPEKRETVAVQSMQLRSWQPQTGVPEAGAFLESDWSSVPTGSLMKLASVGEGSSSSSGSGSDGGNSQ